ncbi:hypothetical protein Nmel_013518 [Mimus melanotis]
MPLKAFHLRCLACHNKKFCSLYLCYCIGYSLYIILSHL